MKFFAMLFLLLFLLLFLIGTGFSARADLPTYEDLGLSESRVEILLKELDQLNTAAFLVMDIRGRILISHGRVNELFDIHSIKKAFLNGLFGTLWDSNLIDLNASIADFGINDDQAPLTTVELQATIFDLLKSRSGVYIEPVREMQYYINRRPPRGRDRPGEQWHYNDWGFDVLGYIFEKISGETIASAIDRRLLFPLGIPKRDRHSVLSDKKHRYSSFGLRTSAVELAEYGRVMLGNPVNGKNLLSKPWIHLSTSTYSDLGRLGGFGLLWWTSPGGRHFGQNLFQEPVFSSWGFGGQHLILFPSSELILVHLTDVKFGEESKGVSYEQMAEVCKSFLAARLSWVEKAAWFVRKIWLGNLRES